jgi:pyruvate/2-oxoglutarate dehydrogenase complex dihydrolipoamide dehydrogenase (E3) component
MTAVPAAPRGGWDLVVVGGGTAGLVGARTAAGFGARVLLVERSRTGGDCLWTGCVPSKALIAAAAGAASARRATGLGIRTGPAEVDFSAVLAQVRAATAAIEPADSPDTLRRHGVQVVIGAARFDGPAALRVDDRPVPFRRVLLATGAEPALPAVPGLAQGSPLTTDSVWQLAQLPGRLLVLGGGSVGCELGQAFARLGSAVTLVEAGPRLLPREDPDAAALIQAALAADGVQVQVGAAVQQIHWDGDAGAGSATVAGVPVSFDRLLVATGRSPRTRGFGLGRAGIGLDPAGQVVVDPRLRTTNPAVWAAGDVTGHPRFTHVAAVHAALAASNAVLGLRRCVDLSAVPRVTFTDPEVAAVGPVAAAGAAEAAARAGGWRVRTQPHDQVDRAITDRRTDGFTRLHVDRRGRLRAATVVGPRAGESLAELSLAVRHGLKASHLAGIHAYPTYSDGVWLAGVAELQAGLATPLTRRVLRLLLRLRRVRARA